TDFRSGIDLLNAAALQPDGKIVVAGTASYDTSDDFGLLRYETNGSLEEGFGVGGKVTTDFGGGDQARAVVIQPDGRIVAAGYTSIGPGGRNYALARYLSDGSLDSNF